MSDLIDQTARRIFNVPADQEVTEEQRSAARCAVRPLLWGSRSSGFPPPRPSEEERLVLEEAWKNTFRGPAGKRIEEVLDQAHLKMLASTQVPLRPGEITDDFTPLLADPNPSRGLQEAHKSILQTLAKLPKADARIGLTPSAGPN